MCVYETELTSTHMANWSFDQLHFVTKALQQVTIIVIGMMDGSWFSASVIRAHIETHAHSRTYTHIYVPSICSSILMGKFLYKHTHSPTHSLTLAALFEKISNSTSYQIRDINNLLKWYASRIQVHVIF